MNNRIDLQHAIRLLDSFDRGDMVPRDYKKLKEAVSALHLVRQGNPTPGGEPAFRGEVLHLGRFLGQ